MRNENDYFDDIQDVKVTNDILDLAKRIVEQKSASFEPENFENHYEAALIDKKRSGVRLAAKPAAKPAAKIGGNVISLMDALKRSLADETSAAPTTARAKGRKKKRIEGQREMLLPINGKRAKEEPENGKAGR